MPILYLQFGQDFNNNYYSHYHCLIFRHNNVPSNLDINLYIRKYHRDIRVTIVNCDNIPDEIFDNIRNNRYCYFYITTDSKSERKRIRNLIKEKCNINTHIMRYSKIIRYLNALSTRK